MILIRCITDGYWNAGGWLFSNCFGTKKRGFVTLFAMDLQPDHPFLAKTTNTPDTENTSDSDTDAPFPIDTSVSSFSGSGNSWFDNWHFLNWHFDLLISLLFSKRTSREIQTRFDGRALTGGRSVKFLICWLPEQSINVDVETTIDRNKLTVTRTGRVYFKSHTSIFTYWFIDQSFDWLDGQNIRRDKSVRHQALGSITLLIYKHRVG